MLTRSGFSPPIPLSVVPSSYFAFPYIVLLIVVLVIVTALLVKFSSLRKYRMKRNILIYFVMALVLALLIFQIDTIVRRANVFYSIEPRDGLTKFYPDTKNQITVYCQSNGVRAADFYIVLKSTNASFQPDADQSYIQVNTTTVKVPFQLHGFSPTEDSKPVSFRIDGNVTSFSFQASLEAQSFNFIDVYSAVYGVTFVWNATEDCYLLDGIAAVMV